VFFVVVNRSSVAFVVQGAAQVGRKAIAHSGVQRAAARGRADSGLCTAGYVLVVDCP
jgi:2-methylisocitrate lyase-like PEP mutase family enzyme